MGIAYGLFEMYKDMSFIYRDIMATGQMKRVEGEVFRRWVCCLAASTAKCRPDALTMTDDDVDYTSMLKHKYCNIIYSR